MTAPNAEGLEGIPRVGDVIGGKLKVTGVLGAGGMGVVLEGQHLDLGQRVAVKVLKPALAKEPDALARFVREARAAASLTSQHAVRIFDVGSDDGLPYIVMERLEGRSVDALLEQRGRLDLDEAVRIVVQASEAIAEANERGIVHRDLKPSNLFVTESGFVKVLDFGISKRVSASELGNASTSLTAPHTLLGSPQYMSPEQLRASREVDARTDVWALGVTLFELLTGKVPFEAETIPDLCAAVLTSEAPRVSDARDDVPGDIDDVVGRCLAKAPEARPAGVPDLVAALLPFCPPDVRSLAESIASHAKGTPAAPGRTSGARKLPPRVSRIAIVGGAAAAFAVSAVVLWVRAERLAPEARPLALEPVPASASAPSPRAEPLPDANSPDAPASPVPLALPASATTPSSRPSAARPTAPPSTPPRVKDLRNIKLID